MFTSLLLAAFATLVPAAHQARATVRDHRKPSPRRSTMEELTGWLTKSLSLH